MKSARTLLLTSLFLSLLPYHAYTQVTLSPSPVLQFINANGSPASGGELFTYQAGTTTKLVTYTDATGMTPNTDPIILNTLGEANVWIQPGSAYKYILAPPGSSDPPTSPIWTVDNISVGSTSVTSTTNLQNTPRSSVPTGIILRVDFAPGNGAPPMWFTSETGNCAANSRVNDGGSCVNAVDGNSWVGQPPSSVWLSSEFGVTATASAASNTTALNAMSAAAFNTGKPWLIDTGADIPANGMFMYAAADGTFSPGSCISMQSAGNGITTLPSPGATPNSGNIKQLVNPCVRMNRFDGTAYMYQASSNGTVVHPYWDSVGNGTYTYNDGIASGAYPDAGFTLKTIDIPAGNNAGAAWWNNIFDIDGNGGTQIATTGCTSSTLSFSAVTGVYDTTGTVYAHDRTTSTDLPRGTTVVSHTPTTVVLSNPCTSVSSGDNIDFTTANVGVYITTTVGLTVTLPNADNFYGGKVFGANIGIWDYQGSRNQFNGIDVSLNGDGIHIGGASNDVQTTVINLNFCENEANYCVNLETEAQDTNITLGGSSGTITPLVNDNGVRSIYPGNFLIGGGSMAVMTQDSGGYTNSAVRIRSNNSSDGGLTLMPNGTNNACLRIYNADDTTGANLGWTNLCSGASGGLEITKSSSGTGTAPPDFTIHLPIFTPSLNTASSGTKALCLQTSDNQMKVSTTGTCP